MHRRFRRLSIVTGLVALFVAAAAGSAHAAVEVKTLKAIDNGPHGAILQGEVTLQGSQPNFAGFEYGETTSYGSESEAVIVPKGSGWYYFQVRVSGLKPGTTYHYRAGTTSGFSAIYGVDKTFTTTQPIFKAEHYPAELSFGTNPADLPVIGVEGGDLTCSTAGGSELGSASGSLTLTPVFKECKFAGFSSATVSMNGCSYVVHAEEGTSDTMDIACPSEKAITVTSGNCAMSIPAQTGLGQLDARAANQPSEGFGVLELDLDISGLKYTKTNDGFLCPFNGTGTKEDGTYGGLIAIVGEYEKGNNALGFVPTAVFQADQYPATLSGQQTAGDPLSLGVEAGGTLTCESITASGALAAEGATMSLAPAYSVCRLFGLNGTTVTLNGCEYAFHAGSVAADTMDIVCPAGKTITVSAGNCGMSIPAQAGLAVEASNDTSGSPQKLQLALGATGLEYTKTKDGFLCPFNGTGTKTDGTYDGTLSVSATNAAKAAIGVGVSS